MLPLIVQRFFLASSFALSVLVNNSCQDNVTELEDISAPIDSISNTVSYKLPNIDLSNWKLTLPVGKPTEFEPPALLGYATNPEIIPYMYNDSINGALVFYTVPGATTANTSYARTELREQMVSGNNNINWTFKQGGRMKGTLSVPEVSKDVNGKYHKPIIMQIHGRLTNEQVALIGAKDNNAPPMLKIYWDNGKVRVKTKELKNLNASEIDILKTDSWTDDEGYSFPEIVGTNKFTLEVKVSDGRMEVILNKTYSKVYDDIHIKKWAVFENYFKAGNYLTTNDNGAFAKVKYFDLTVTH